MTEVACRGRFDRLSKHHLLGKPTEPLSVAVFLQLANYKNKNMKDLSVIVLAVVIGVVGFLNYTKSPVVVQTNGEAVSLGAQPSPDVYTPTYYRAGVVEGGSVVSTSTANSSATLLNTDLVSRSGYTSLLKVTPTGANLSLTLPASSTLSNFAPNAGDRVRVVIENGATSATTTTIVAGAGMDLQEPDGQNVVIGQNNYAVLDFLRDSNGNFIVTVDETIPAD